MVSAARKANFFRIIPQAFRENNLVFPLRDKILFFLPGFPGRTLDEPDFPVYIAGRPPRLPSNPTGGTAEMVYTLTDPEKVRPLFGSWEETMIISCLQR